MSLNKKVKYLLDKLKKTTGETIGWYLASSNKPYPKDKSKIQIKNRVKIPSTYFLTMGDVKKISGNRTLNVLEPDDTSSPKYTIKLLDNDDSMFIGTDNNYGWFYTRSGSEGDINYDDEYAFSSRKYNPWIVIETGLDKYLEKIISIAEKNMATVKATEYKIARDKIRTRWDIRTEAERDRDLRRVRDLERREKERKERRDRERRDRERRDKYLRNERDIEMRRAEEAEARLIRGAEETKKKQRKKSKKKSRVKDSGSGDGGLAPTLLLGGLLGVLAVLVGMK